MNTLRIHYPFDRWKFIKRELLIFFFFFSMKLESRIIPFEDFFPLSAFEGFTKKIDVNLLMKTKRRKLYMEI